MSGELNVIDSGTVVFVRTNPEEFPRVTHFIYTWYHVMFIPVHDTPLSTIVLAGNNSIALRILSNLKDACLFCSQECTKEF